MVDTHHTHGFSARNEASSVLVVDTHEALLCFGTNTLGFCALVGGQ
jgi:hypothetical protein